MAASAITTDGVEHTVELVVLENPESATDRGLAVPDSKEIIPLLSQAERPKINIFKDFRSREKPLVSKVNFSFFLKNYVFLIAWIFSFCYDLVFMC